MALFPDNFGVGARADDAYQALAVQVEVQLEVFTLDSQLIELLAIHILFAKRLDGDVPRRHILRNKNGKSLCASLVPIVEPGKHDVLVVEVVVEDGDLRGMESELLREGPGALHVELNGGRRSLESDVRRSLLLALR